MASLRQFLVCCRVVPVLHCGKNFLKVAEPQVSKATRQLDMEACSRYEEHTDKCVHWGGGRGGGGGPGEGAQKGGSERGGGHPTPGAILFLWCVQGQHVRSML